MKQQESKDKLEKFNERTSLFSDKIDKETMEILESIKKKPLDFSMSFQHTLMAKVIFFIVLIIIIFKPKFRESAFEEVFLFIKKEVSQKLREYKEPKDA